MQVFRTKGYHAASVADLAADMGLTVGSTYKTFRDKQTFFYRCLNAILVSVGRRRVSRRRWPSPAATR
ncbi:MAG: TetR/AcrR family transcriptional regulator [Sodalis sp. (in: enterobacteria)]|uniref:TetR/AcrR family transcriptional regulator n=1 Tax=Sodalis sp. (in: enterobacteria) TaxID=1898979 RepID=UPI003F39BE54